MPPPTQRTLQRMRAAGLLAAVVEKWNPHARVRHDLFGFIDVLAISPVTGRVFAVQTTSESNASARVHKIIDSPDLHTILGAGWSVEVWGWRKVGARWALKRRIIDHGEGDTFDVAIVPDGTPIGDQ